MNYSKVAWQDSPSTATPVNATNLGVMDQGVADAWSAINRIDVLSEFNAAYGSTSLGFDYEFEGSGTTLPSGWSWQNQGSAAYAEGLGVGVISGNGGAGATWRSVLQSLAGAPASWTAVGKFCLIGDTSNYFSGGLVLRDSSTSKLAVTVWSSNAGTPNASMSKYTNDTTYSASWGGPVSMLGGLAPFYLRLKKNSATSYDTAISYDGVTWGTIVTGIDVSAWMTPNQIGFAFDQEKSATTPGAIGCHWFRMR